MVDLILEVKNLSGGYGDLLVVRDISLEILSGQVVSITGRNGVGKTTLLKLIFGNLKPSEGEVCFLNSNLEKIASHKRLDLGISYAPQENIVFDDLTLQENLTLHYEESNLDHYHSLFEKFPRLRERLDQKAGTLSGGEKKLLSFARAVAEPSKLILLDEPTEGVQSDNIELMAQTIREEKSRGRGFLIVDQNLTFLESFNDIMHLIDHGEQVFKIEGVDFRKEIEARIII